MTKPVLTIKVDMNVPCKRKGCKEKGATQNGYCLRCIADLMPRLTKRKAAEKGEVKHDDR